MNYSPNIWNQLKNLTDTEIVKALKKDGWTEEPTRGAIPPFIKETKRVTIHYHGKKTYGQKLLRGILDDIDWSEDDINKIIGD